MQVRHASAVPDACELRAVTPGAGQKEKAPAAVRLPGLKQPALEFD
jgi:hypothetical protein